MGRYIMRNAKKLRFVLVASVTASVTLYLAGPVGSTVAKGADIDQRLPAPLVDETPKGSGMETLIIAGGCFWGVQGVFQHVRGGRQCGVWLWQHANLWGLFRLLTDRPGRVPLGRFWAHKMRVSWCRSWYGE
jgi:hypothetical protein